MPLGDRLLMICEVSVKTVCVSLISPFFWLTIWFTYRYYLQYEWDKASAGYLALASSLEGMAAGFFVIWLTALLGVVIRPGMALYVIGPMAMVLSLVHPRFFCLAYGAGITLIVCTLLQIPVDLFGISGIVAILHLAEGILVLVRGGKHTIITCRQKKGEIISEKGICRFWPVPICLLITAQTGVLESLNMPEWWPLLSSASLTAEEALGMLPMAASLGYSDLFEKNENAVKRRSRNGILIICYAVVLLGLCMVFDHTIAGKWVTILWMVAGHEAIIFLPEVFTKN